MSNKLFVITLLLLVGVNVSVMLTHTHTDGQDDCTLLASHQSALNNVATYDRELRIGLGDDVGPVPARVVYSYDDEAGVCVRGLEVKR